MKLLFPFFLLFVPGCKKHPAYEELYVHELVRDPFQVLTTDDTEELAKFNIYYDMDRNKR